MELHNKKVFPIILSMQIVDMGSIIKNIILSFTTNPFTFNQLLLF